MPKKNKHFNQCSIGEKAFCITDGLCITRVVIVGPPTEAPVNVIKPTPALADVLEAGFKPDVDRPVSLDAEAVVSLGSDISPLENRLAHEPMM